MMQPRDKFFSALIGIRTAGASCGLPGGIEVLAADDHLDADGMESVRAKVMSSARRGNWNYIFDLTRVTTMDSPGLGMLVSALRAIRDLGGLELCARDRGCQIFSRTAEALSALSGHPQPRSAA